MERRAIGAGAFPAFAQVERIGVAGHLHAARQRIDTLDPPGRTEARLAQHRARCRIVGHVARGQPLDPQTVPRGVDQRANGFGGIAAAPGVGGDPEAQVVGLALQWPQAHAADDPRRTAAVCGGDDE